MSRSAPQGSDGAGDRRPRRRRLSAASRRETILEAALQLFASAGYERTRTSDIARRVGVTEPVIFQNFGTKAGLFAAVLERAARDAAQHFAALAEERASVHDWLGHLLSAEYLDRLHAAPMFGVFFADAHAHHAEPSIGGAIHRSVTLVADAMAVILRRGQLEGSIRDDTSPDTLAWLVVSLIQARELRRTHAAEQSPALERDLLASILGALRPGSHRPDPDHRA